MLPSSVYCRNCGGYIREEMSDGFPLAGTHDRMEDCIEELKNRLSDLEKRIEETPHYKITRDENGNPTIHYKS